MKTILLFILAASAVNGFAQTPEMRLINSVAEALGGRERVLSLKTLTIYGYGQQAYQNRGGNITASVPPGTSEIGPTLTIGQTYENEPHLVPGDHDSLSLDDFRRRYVEWRACPIDLAHALDGQRDVE